MKTSLILFALFCHALVSAIPGKAPPRCSKDEERRRQREVKDYLQRRAKGLYVKRTTVTPGGQVLDWIPIDSQVRGKIADQPPKLERLNDFDSKMPDNFTGFELDDKKVPRGPRGTVPVLRPNFSAADFSIFTLDELLRKKLEEDNSQGKRDPDQSPRRVKRQAANLAPHWYARAYEFVKNYGGQAQFSVFEPFIEKNDFSLLQMAVVSEGVGAVKQTLEAGTIVQEARYKDRRSHLFTFFTTNGYGDYGDNVQGWNREFKGWVQVADGIYPGCILKPAGRIDDVQYKTWMVYRLFEGNWWLWVHDRWIGYYPARLFSDNQPDASKTLADHANKLSMYGEVLDKNTADDSSVTTSDMGSGIFAREGFRRSAYMHHLLYFAGRENVNTRYGRNAVIAFDDANRYTIEEHFNNTGTWDSYMFLGGPGRA